MKHVNKFLDWFEDYIMRTWKNKLMALCALGLGFLPTIIFDNNAGLLFGIPAFICLFFATKNIMD